MENQEQKKITFSNDPQYFGSYLNMARLNIFNISNHLADKFGITPIDDDEKISSSFLVNKDDKKFKNKQNHIFSNLVRYMPIAKVFDSEKLPKSERDNFGKDFEKNFNKLSDTLKVVFSEINEFRNDYTHYYSTEKQTKRKKKVSNELKKFLNKNIERAIHYTQDRFKGVFSEDDFNIASQTVVVNDDNSITQDGIVFLTTMFLDRENAFQFINKITGLKGTQTKGFKAKREVLMAFCVKLPHDKFVSENTEQAFSLKLINELNKCPKTLYNVITEEEIKKYKFKPQLEAEQKENVIQNSVPDTIDDYENYIESIIKKIRNENRFSYFALKFIDQKKLFKKWRFQIDLGKIILAQYPKILNGKEETRTIVENVKAFGRLQDLNDKEKVLNKINTGDNKIHSEQFQFAPHYNFDDKNNKIGIYSKKEVTAKYLSKKTDKKVKCYLKQPLPEAFLSIHELPKIVLLEYLKKGKAEQLINDFIEINNSKILNKKFIETIKSKLSDLSVFYKRSQGRKQINAYLTKNKKIDFEKIKELENRKEKLNQILAEYKLSAKQIPTRILDYWLNIKDVQTKTAISDRIKLMKRDCIDRLKAIEKRKAPKIGEMATFLAKDIVDMIIGKEKKQKITSFYYDKMQECLALFADKEKKELFIHICNNELKLNDDNGHPFLKNINLSNIRYTADLYKRYLEEKGKKMVKEYNNRKGKYVETDKSWLQNNFYNKEWNENAKKNLTIVKLPDDKSKLPFTLCQLEKEKPSFNKWLENVTNDNGKTIRKKPVDLPVNLFDNELKELLKTELSKNNIKFRNDANYNELFKIWWKKCRKDDIQNFYNAEREYTFYDDKLNFKINTKPKFKNYYTKFAENVFNKKQAIRNEERKTKSKLPLIEKTQVIKTIRKKIGNTEKKIRMLQEEDRLMLLMFEKLTKKDLNLKLKDVGELLNERIEIKENISGKLSFNDLGEIIKKKENRKKITRNITETRKRKEYSVLKKYVFDRRLPELFEYFKEDNIPMKKIKIELDAYNKVKDIIFDIVFKLEKAIIDKDENKIKKLNKDRNGNIQSGNIPHKPYLLWLLEKKIISDKEFTFMNMIRNTFSHNQFPQKKTMMFFIKQWNKEKFAYQILEIYKQKTDNIIEKLKDM